MTQPVTKLRLCFGLLAIVSGIWAIFPSPVLALVDESAFMSRSPERVELAIRGVFVASAAACALAAAYWSVVENTICTFVAQVANAESRVVWAAVVAIALLARLGFFFIDYEPHADGWWLHEAGRSLAAGEGFQVGDGPTAYRPPGYPTLLAFTYRVFGPDLRLAWVWGLLSTAVLLVAVHRIAVRMYGETPARLATATAAAYPALAAMTGQSLSDLTFTAALMALVLFMISCRPFGLMQSLTIGAVTALLTLTRGTAIGLFCVLPFIWLLRERDYRRLALSLAATTLAFVLCVTPWVLRNHAVLGSATLATNVGTNLYVGNHPGAGGGSVPRMWPHLPPAIESDEVAHDHALFESATGFIRKHPLQAAAILPKKLASLYLLETEAITSLFQGQHQSPAWLKYTLYGVSQIWYVLLLLLLLSRLRDMAGGAARLRGIQWTGFVLAAYFTCVCLVFHGEDRYRLPILPWMMIEAAVALATIAARSAANATRPPSPLEASSRA